MKLLNSIWAVKLEMNHNISCLMCFSLTTWDVVTPFSHPAFVSFFVLACHCCNVQSRQEAYETCHSMAEGEETRELCVYCEPVKWTLACSITSSAEGCELGNVLVYTLQTNCSYFKLFCTTFVCLIILSLSTKYRVNTIFIWVKGFDLCS